MKRENCSGFERILVRYLSPSRCILEGFVAILDIGGTLLNEVEDEESEYEKDCEAIWGDWFLVGQSIQDAIDTFPEREISGHLVHER